MIYMYSTCSVYVGKFSNRRKEVSEGYGATPWHLIDCMVYDSDLGLICVDIEARLLALRVSFVRQTRV